MFLLKTWCDQAGVARSDSKDSRDQHTQCMPTSAFRRLLIMAASLLSTHARAYCSGRGCTAGNPLLYWLACTCRIRSLGSTSSINEPRGAVPCHNKPVQRYEQRQLSAVCCAQQDRQGMKFHCDVMLTCIICNSCAFTHTEHVSSL